MNQSKYGRLFCLLILLYVCAAAMGKTSAGQPEMRSLPPSPAVNRADNLRAPSPPSAQPRTAQASAPFPNVQIINDGSQQTETSIAINPINPLNAVCSANDFACIMESNDLGMRCFYTMDGGAAWAPTCIPVPAGEPFNLPFDPSVAYDARGNVYVCFGDATSKANGETYQNTIYVAKSTDGGETFQTAVPVASDTLDGPSGSGGNTVQPFYDKMYMACDASTSGADQYRGRLYVAWTNFAPSGNTNLESYSSDGGKTWSTPTDFAGSAPGQSAIPCTGPDGTLYITWGLFGIDETDIFIVRSDDGGNTFSAPASITPDPIQIIGMFNADYGRTVLPDKDSMRIGTFPSIAVDNSPNAQTRGSIYVAWQGLGTDFYPHAFLEVITPTQSALQFGTPMVIDHDYVGNDVFYPTVACDPTNGGVYVDYYDSRNSPGNSAVDIYCAASPAGANSFIEFRVTDDTTEVLPESPDPASGYYWGDYQGIAASGGLVLPCWWESVGSYNDTHIFTAPIRLSPAPVTNITVNSACNATSAAVQWTDPTVTTLDSALTTYSLILYRNGAVLSLLPQGSTHYTDFNLTNGRQYIYSIVVSAPTSQAAVIDSLSAAVSDTVMAGGSDILNAPGDFTLRPVQGGVEAVWQSPAQHTDGTESCDLHAIYFYSESSKTPAVPLDSMLVSSSDGGSFQSHTITLDTTKIWDVYAAGVALRGSTYAAGDSSNHFSSFAGAPLQQLHENFDAPVLLWTAANAEGAPWSTSSEVSVSPPNCLVTNPAGKFPRRDTSFCQLPPFIRSSTDTALEFDHILLVNVFETGNLELTTNNGVTWTPIRQYSKASYLPEWHDDSLPVAQCTWVHENISLNPFSHAGDTVSLRFVFDGGFQQSFGWFIDNINVDSAAPISVPELIAAPSAEFALNQNYPNPFNPATSISFSLPISARARIDVYNAIGEHVQTLTDAFMNAGQYAVNFDASQLPQGVYFYKLRAGEYSE